MKALELRVPPLLVVAIAAGGMWGLSRRAAPLAIHTEVRILLAGALLMLGIGACAAGLLAFRRARTTVNPLEPQRASTLVVSGIYQVSRNPMYLGFALMLLAWTVWLAVPLTLLGVAGFVVYITRFQIVPEERALTERFGADFDDYRQRVRAWI
jgi:protein-S-isoprenylcysteine O-methyltransferase Ste14